MPAVRDFGATEAWTAPNISALSGDYDPMPAETFGNVISCPIADMHFDLWVDDGTYIAPNMTAIGDPPAGQTFYDAYEPNNPYDVTITAGTGYVLDFAWKVWAYAIHERVASNIDRIVIREDTGGGFADLWADGLPLPGVTSQVLPTDSIRTEKFVSLDPDWIQIAGSGEFALVDDDDASDGKALRIQGPVALELNENINCAWGSLNKVRAKLRQVADPETGGKNLRIGVTGLNPSIENPSWYDVAWSSRIEVTILASDVASDITDEPFRFVLTSANTPAAFWSTIQTDTDDIRVTSSNGTTEIAHFVQTYSIASQYMIIRCRGNLSSSSDNKFFIYCGNAAAAGYAVGDTYGRDNAIGSDLKASYGFDGWTDGATSDDLALAPNMSEDGTINVATGYYGDGVDFDNASFDVENTYFDAQAASATKVTIEAWHKFDSVGDVLGALFWSGFREAGNGNYSPQYELSFGHATNPGSVGKFLRVMTASDFNGASMWVSTSEVVVDAEWHHYAAVIDTVADNIDLYIDGVEIASSGTMEGSFWAAGANAELAYLGRSRDGSDSGELGGGATDFIEVSFDARSASMIALNAMQAPAQIGILEARLGEQRIEHDGTIGLTDQYFLAAKDQTLTKSFTYTEFAGYFLSRDTTGTSTEATDLNAPALLHENVEYVRLLILCNWPDGDGTVYLDEMALEVVQPNGPYSMTHQITGKGHRYQADYKVITRRQTSDDSDMTKITARTNARCKGFFEDSLGTRHDGVLMEVFRESTDLLVAQGTTAAAPLGEFDIEVPITDWHTTVYVDVVAREGKIASNINGGVAAHVQV